MKNYELIKARGAKLQKEMADRIGVTQQAYSNWENGNIPPLPKMLLLEEILGVPKEKLFPMAFKLKKRTA
jgi:transcriptional regulator with XRE-family HTH domain